MNKKFLALFLAAFMVFTVGTLPAEAHGIKEAGSSLLLPTTGQAMNGELGSTKTKIMAGVEVAAITTLAVLGTVVGGGVVWAALGPMIANHGWSSYDAYKGAQKKVDPAVQMQIDEAQRMLEYSRQRRLEREQIRERENPTIINARRIR